MQMTEGSKVFIKNEQLGKYLFQLRDNEKNIPNPNCWGLLGGGIDEDESPLEGLLREISEESNIVLTNIKLLGSLEVRLVAIGKQKDVTNHFFVAETVFDVNDIELYEGQKVEYLTLEEFKSRNNVVPGVLKAVNKFDILLR